MNLSSRYLKLLLIVLTVAILALTVEWWLSYPLQLLGFINANSNVIQGLTDFVQLGIWLIGIIVIVAHWLRGNQSAPQTKDSKQGEQASTSREPSSKYSVTSENIGAVGEGNLVEMTIHDKQPKGK